MSKDCQVMERLRACEAQLVQTRAEVRELGALLGALTRELRVQVPFSRFAAEQAEAVQPLSEGTSFENKSPGPHSPSLLRDPELGYCVEQQSLHLTPGETLVLDTLWNAMPQRVSRKQFNEALYGQEMTSENVSLDVFLSRLRGKLRQALGRELIEVKRGQGWALRP